MTVLCAFLSMPGARHGLSRLPFHFICLTFAFIIYSLYSFQKNSKENDHDKQGLEERDPDTEQ